MKPMSMARRQRGAALVVGLLMLLALTLIGVTNMGMNTMELRMANNAQNKAHAFQAAEAGIDVGISIADYTDISGPQTIPPPSLAYATVTITAEHRDFTQGVFCPGQSFEGVRCNNFEIDSTGAQAASNASSRQVQGVYTLAPILGAN